MIDRLRSRIASGRVYHHRYTPVDHQFQYPMYMMQIDLDELETLDRELKGFSINRWAPLRFQTDDYLGQSGNSVKQKVIDKVSELDESACDINRVVFVGQIRCFGFYFSPVNFYFCYCNEQLVYMLAEVSNTPWNERHCYLVNVDQPEITDKTFHVSPFMGLDMKYHWRIAFDENHVLVDIENWQQDKLFDATLNLQSVPLTRWSAMNVLKQWPMMTLSVVKGIYWQALKLFIKNVPYHSHP